MERIIKAKPAPYPKTNTQEIEAILTFVSLIDINRIKPDTKFLDKFPNTDGLLEIVDLEQIPIGKIEIQIKYLNPEFYKSPKYQCDKKFLAYCEDSLLPVLLILVNTQEKIAYWHHINIDTLKTISKSIGTKESATIHFFNKNLIFQNQNEYLESWIKIINDQKKKIYDYDKLEIRIAQLNEAYSNLNKDISGKPAKQNPIFRELHIFLDYYNKLLDDDFKTIKTILYPSYWKIGIGIIDYQDKSIIFLLYPIRYELNDTLIKEINSNSKRPTNIIKSIGYYYENPIKSKPKRYSYELIEQNIEESLKLQPLLPRDNIVATEYLFSFLDKYRIFINLEKKNEYNILDIYISLKEFLPLLIDLSISAKNTNSQEFIYSITLDYVFQEISRIEFKKLIEKTIDSLSKGIKPKTKYHIETYFLNYNIALFFIEQLHSLQIKTIKRVFIDRKVPEKGVYYAWEAFGENNTIQNIEIFYKYFPTAYDNLVKSYFPNLFNELKFYKDFELLIVIVDFSKTSSSFMPSIDYIFCSLFGSEEKVVILKRSDPINPIKGFNIWEHGLDHIEFEDKHYTIKHWRSSILDFIYGDSPLLTSLEILLKERLKQYLQVLIFRH